MLLDNRSPDLWKSSSWCLMEGAVTYAVLFDGNALPSIYSLVTRRVDATYWHLVLLEHLGGPPSSQHRIGSKLYVIRDGPWVPPRDLYATLETAQERAAYFINERYEELAKMISMAHIGRHTLDVTLPAELTLVVHYGGKTITLQPSEGALSITAAGEGEQHG